MNKLPYTIENGVLSYVDEKGCAVVRLRDINLAAVTGKVVTLVVGGHVFKSTFSEDYIAEVFVADIKKAMISESTVKTFNFKY